MVGLLARALHVARSSAPLASLLGLESGREGVWWLGVRPEQTAHRLREREAAESSPGTEEELGL